MKIRIFALAKELELDSKELISIANDAGIALKNSALASVSEEERDTIVNHIKQLGAKSSQETSAEPAAPIRDETRDTGGKVRTIKAMTPRPQHAGKSESEEAVATQENGSRKMNQTQDDAAGSSDDRSRNRR